MKTEALNYWDIGESVKKLAKEFRRVKKNPGYPKKNHKPGYPE